MAPYSEHSRSIRYVKYNLKMILGFVQARTVPGAKTNVARCSFYISLGARELQAAPSPLGNISGVSTRGRSVSSHIKDGDRLTYGTHIMASSEFMSFGFTRSIRAHSGKELGV